MEPNPSASGPRSGGGLPRQRWVHLIFLGTRCARRIDLLKVQIPGQQEASVAVELALDPDALTGPDAGCSSPHLAWWAGGALSRKGRELTSSLPSRSSHERPLLPPSPAISPLLTDLTSFTPHSTVPDPQACPRHCVGPRETAGDESSLPFSQSSEAAGRDSIFSNVTSAMWTQTRH